MASVEGLCDSGIYLEKGKIRDKGSVKETVRRYLSCVLSQIQATPIRERKNRIGTGRLQITDVILHGPEGSDQLIRVGQDAIIDIFYESKYSEPISNILFAVNTSSTIGQPVTALRSDYTKETFTVTPSKGVIRCRLPRLPLSPGSYLLNVYIGAGREIIDWIQEAVEMTVSESDFYGTGRIQAGNRGH